MPPGNKSGQPAGAFPLYGEGEIRQQTSGIDIVTITAASSQDADFLVCRKAVPEGSTRVDSEVFVISSAGAIAKGGLYGTVTASSGGATIGSSQSGALFKLAGTTAAAVITMPTPAAGLNFRFFIETAPTTGGYSWTCATTGAFIVSGDSGADGFTLSTVIGPAGGVEIVGLSATKYAVFPIWTGASAVGSTTLLASAYFAAAS